MQERFGYDDAVRVSFALQEAMDKQEFPERTRLDGVILGSGLGGFVNDHLEKEPRVEIPFPDLFEKFGIPASKSSVAGHAKSIVLGRLKGAPESALVIAQSGREHPYEGVTTRRATFWVRVMQVMGTRMLIGSNAAGILTPKTLTPPALMAIAASRDDVGDNPLIGLNDNRLGPRFPHMGDLYTEEVRKRMRTTAESMDVRLQEGVYFRTSGPNYEDSAHVYELRARLHAMRDQAIAQPGENGFQQLTAVVGMSSTYEALVAQHASQSLRFPAFQDGIGFVSVATNYAAALGPNGIVAPPHHEEVQQRAVEVQKNFGALIHGTLLSMQRRSTDPRA